MQDVTPRVYRPELISRRGETMAWVLAAAFGLGWLVLVWRDVVSPWIGGGFIILHLAIAGVISLGNWVDRATRIEIDANGIRYSNGLRQVALAWPEIKAVRIFAGRFGKTVQVVGERGYFSFRTLAEVTLNSGLTNRMGFVNGEEIMREIVLKSGLQIEDRPGEGSYYTRP